MIADFMDHLETQLHGEASLLANHMPLFTIWLKDAGRSEHLNTGHRANLSLPHELTTSILSVGLDSRVGWVRFLIFIHLFFPQTSQAKDWRPDAAPHRLRRAWIGRWIKRQAAEQDQLIGRERCREPFINIQLQDISSPSGCLGSAPG